MLAALQRAGVAVPGEVSVAGYDDDTLARLSSAAVERLDQDRAEPREVVLTPELVVRGTIAEPRDG